jgi:hypothetical protein
LRVFSVESSFLLEFCWELKFDATKNTFIALKMKNEELAEWHTFFFQDWSDTHFEWIFWAAQFLIVLFDKSEKVTQHCVMTCALLGHLPTIQSTFFCR